MNLISCENCGVVLDKNLLNFPDMYDEEGCIIHGTCEWNGVGYDPKVKCPVCGEDIIDRS